MKILLIGLLTLGSLSTFAGQCDVYVELMESGKGVQELQSKITLQHDKDGFAQTIKEIGPFKLAITEISENSLQVLVLDKRTKKVISFSSPSYPVRGPTSFHSDNDDYGFSLYCNQ